MKNCELFDRILSEPAPSFGRHLQNRQECKQIAPLLHNDPYGDLTPLPEVKPLLKNILAYLNSAKMDSLCKQSKALPLLRDGLLTSLFHLNLKPELDDSNKPEYSFIENSYPYEPVYLDPFPKRPSLEFLQQTLNFISSADSITGGPTRESLNLSHKIKTFVPLKNFCRGLYARLAPIYQNRPQAPKRLSEAEIIDQPVKSYMILRERLEKYGELASFPEFEFAVKETLNKLRNDSDFKTLMLQDRAFKTEVRGIIDELRRILKNYGDANLLSPRFQNQLPYRRTILALERAIFAFDIKERTKYKTSESWYEVENSWLPEHSGHQGSPLLLDLYHYNRYKYQQFGLLTNLNVVLLPWCGQISKTELIKTRSAPLGLIGINYCTQRADRHHNTPIDFWYHDINHIRRMWGYDRKSFLKKKILTRLQLFSELKGRQDFIDDLLSKTDLNKIQESEPLAVDKKNLQKMKREILFESFHETALPATREAVLNDLFRIKAVRQPFERMVLVESQIELLRTFDGNVYSGANKFLKNISLDAPVRLLYYWDRAPNFLANVDNKGRWGFHGSVYEQRWNPFFAKFFSPTNLARAALDILDLVNFRDGENGQHRPSLSMLRDAAISRNGQRELWHYWALRSKDDISQQGIEIINSASIIDFMSPEAQVANEISSQNSNLSGPCVAEMVDVNCKSKELVHWMLCDLEKYIDDFETLFEKKLKRIREHQSQRIADLNVRLDPLQKRMINASADELVELNIEVARFKKELRPHGFVESYSDSAEFTKKFVGAVGKVLLSQPSQDEQRLMNHPKRKRLYVDTSSVPFFNTGTQTKEQARAGINQAISEFRNSISQKNISFRKFADLVALFVRPEFDDLRRYKVKFFPTEADVARFGKERTDACFVGKHFPNQYFLFTNQKFDLNPLSYTFGQRLHVMGLFSHQDESVRADGRIFTGPSDFLEHDIAHAYYNLMQPFHGTKAQWRTIHDRFFYSLNTEPDTAKRKMMGLVYFHLTHESGYTNFSPGIPKKNLKREISDRINTRHYYDSYLHAPEFKGECFKYLDLVFDKVFRFFEAEFLELQVK